MEKKSTTIVKKTTVKTTKEPTLLEAMEHVAELSRNSRMSNDFYVKALTDIKFISESYGITLRQAVLFCVCMEQGPHRVDYNDIAQHLDVSKMRALSYAADIDALVRRRLLRFRDVKDEDDFDVPTVVIRKLKHNEVYQLPKRTELDCAGVFEFLCEWFKDLSDDAIGSEELIEEIQQLFKDNAQVDFVKQMEGLHLCGGDLLLLSLFCHLWVNENDDEINFCQMENCFSKKQSFTNAKINLCNGSHELMRKNLIEHCCIDGVADVDHFKLTESAKRNLLAELTLATTEEKVVGVLNPDQLTPKTLFFTESVDKQVSELKGFFDVERYKAIRERMQQRGFRQGFACLFYGGPGTGKTETVYQLSRETGRALMVVDVPSIRSKWVGETEQNVKAVFDRYRELVKRSTLAPILLFNEADALIGTRKVGAQNAVDKMENTMQNIILQEMEDLDGIMIATTNLTENLDPAFERRFLYKIMFEKPDAAVRQKIWQQMIPELKDSDASVLASQYDFSGGQIENVARKHAINSILYGNDSEMLPILEDYCCCEQLNNNVTRKRIGF
jgi:ATP-dependent 26S proteasome regulatory subunit